MKTGIYKIRHRSSNRVYIGSSKDVFTRMRKHKERLNRNNHSNKFLQNAWNKYHENDFEFSILFICEFSDLIFYEQRAIDIYRASDKIYGFNIRKNASSNIGLIIERKIYNAGDKYGRLTLIACQEDMKLEINGDAAVIAEKKF